VLQLTGAATAVLGVRSLAALLFSFSVATVARRFNELGHAVIAKIASDNLQAHQRAAVHQILRRHPHYTEYLTAELPDGVSEEEWSLIRASCSDELILLFESLSTRARIRFLGREEARFRLGRRMCFLLATDTCSGHIARVDYRVPCLLLGSRTGFKVSHEELGDRYPNALGRPVKISGNQQ